MSILMMKNLIREFPRRHNEGNDFVFINIGFSKRKLFYMKTIEKNISKTSKNSNFIHISGLNLFIRNGFFI